MAIETFKDSSKVDEIADSEWTDDNDPFFQLDPSGDIRGFSICLIPPSGNIDRVPDYNEVTDNGGAWILAGSDFGWDEGIGWQADKWQEGDSERQNYWNVIVDGVPPSGILEV
jgi:hypothetical protein